MGYNFKTIRCFNEMHILIFFGFVKHLIRYIIRLMCFMKSLQEQLNASYAKNRNLYGKTE